MNHFFWRLPGLRRKTSRGEIAHLGYAWGHTNLKEGPL